MFSGIIEALAEVCEIVAEGPGRRLVIKSPWTVGGVAIGDSVAINGVCLTVVQFENGLLGFQAGPETLDRTNLGELAAGERVNLERALLPTTRLGGHFVQGHIDGTAVVAESRRQGDWTWVDFAADPGLTAIMVPKGSVAVDGVSLTLVDVLPARFQVMLIPHTLKHTTLGFRSTGTKVNVETDILGKYVLQAVRLQQSPTRT